MKNEQDAQTNLSSQAEQDADAAAEPTLLTTPIEAAASPHTPTPGPAAVAALGNPKIRINS